MPTTETPPPPLSTRYLTTAEAASTAQVAPKTIRRWTREGRLRAHWAGRLLRIRLDELESFLAGGAAATTTMVSAEDIAQDILGRRSGGSR